MVVRSLLTFLGFKSDNEQLKKYDKALQGVIRTTKWLAVGTAAMAGVFLKGAGEIEQVEVAFETMLGSAEKARDLLEQITKFAASTPFQLTGLIDSSKQLLAFGFDMEEIIPTMTNLGNIAAGVGRDKLPSIVRALGKIRTKGRATMEELNIMLEAGVPILDELAKGFGVATTEIIKMVSKGVVSFNDVDAALERMSTGTGKFSGLMEKQSKKFLGILSNIGDILTNIGNAIGKKLLPGASSLSKAFLEFLEINKEIIVSGVVSFFEKLGFVIAVVFLFMRRLIQEILDTPGIVEGLAGAFDVLISVLKTVIKIGAGIVEWVVKYKEVVAVLLTTLGTYIVITKGIWLWTNRAAIATKALAAAQAALNVVTKVNPIVLLISAVVGLVAGLVLLIKNWDRVIAFLEDKAPGVLKIFRDIRDGIIQGWEDVKNFVEKAIDFILEKWEKFTSALDRFKNELDIALTPFFDKIKEIIDQVKYEFDIIKEYLSTIFSPFFDSALEVIDKLKTEFQALKDWFGDLFSGIAEFVAKINPWSKENKENGTATRVENFLDPEALTKIPSPTESFSNRNTTNLNVNSEVKITVPEGTPEMQIKAVKKAGEKAVRDQWNLFLGESYVNIPGVD